MTGRKSHPPLEPALRQFETMNDGGLQFARQHACPGKNQLAIVDNGFDVLRVDPGQRYQNKDFPFCL